MRIGVSLCFQKFGIGPAFLRGRGKGSEARGRLGCVPRSAPLLHYNPGVIVFLTLGTQPPISILCFRSPRAIPCIPWCEVSKTHLLILLFLFYRCWTILWGTPVCVSVCARSVYVSVCVNCISMHVWYIFFFEWWHSCNHNIGKIWIGL